jgi:hypothetical protein
MATGKRAKDIFQSTTRKPDIGLEVAPRVKGRPAGPEYVKVTVVLFPKHVLFLDKVALAIRERTGKPVKRAELIRALVDRASTWIDPAGKDFDKTIRDLLPGE